ncbi:uncharacterized protein LOC129574749 [Sitodiplosis mosellana]|uniref:uncharacterized protein LOC129574749 n=1 Tax=Sitodiplosis mosellana TaxID=263140 RepID=UPI0024452538|nr:uncharacterized protein LOC129574749 [Sitodiplosis mosellana]
MFRTLLRNLTITKNAGDKLLKCRPFTTAAPLAQEEEEYNYVKLLGTIVSNVRTLPNGTRSLIVRTVEGNDKYCNHLVNLKSDAPMSMGERIYIFGNLSSKPFSLDDGRLRQKLIIKSKYSRLRGHERNIENKNDQNNVKILAKITSDIRHADNHSLFTLSSNHMPKGEGRIPGMIITEFHRVIVYDQPALGVLRNSISKFDRVLVEGKVSYMPYKITSGKTQHGGFIVAQSIQRIE